MLTSGLELNVCIGCYYPSPHDPGTHCIPPQQLSSFRDDVKADTMASGGHIDADEGSELVVRGRSFPRSPPSAEIEPAVSPWPAPAVHYQDPEAGSASEPPQSPFAVLMSAQDPEPAGLELQPMLSGMAGDSSALTAGSEPRHTPLPLSTASATDAHWSNSPAALRSGSVDPAGPIAAKRGPSAQSVPFKRNWHAAIRQRLKLRVSH